MKTLGKKSPKKVASPQPQRRKKASAHWHPPTIYYPRQTRFCQTKEDFHEEYGLSLEGVDPRYLGDVPEDQWLSVFTQKHLNNEKIHLKLVQPEFLEDCALLYHKVYQNTPPNHEITIKFARGFAFERCTLARSPMDMAKYKVAWAVFAEGVISNVTLRKKLLTKIALWKAKNGASTVLPPLLPRQDSFETSPGGQPLSSEQPSREYDMDYCIQPACFEHVDMASLFSTAAMEKLKQKEKLVIDCMAALDEAKTRRDKAKGVSSAADALKEKISRAKKELQILECESLTHDEALLWRLKAEIMGCEVALDLLGPDVCISTLDKDVHELEELHNRLLKGVEDANVQSCFVKELVKVIEKIQVPSLAVAPPKPNYNDKGTLTIENECVACGFSFEDNEVVGVYMLPCRHPYHPICFAVMCCMRKDCMQSGCKQNIPSAAKKMVLPPAPMLLKHNLLEGEEVSEFTPTQSTCPLRKRRKHEV